MTAVDRTWVGATDVWDLASNWSPDGVPDADDTAFIVSGSQDIAGDAGAETGVTRIVVGPQYTGTIGSVLLPLKISVSVELDYGGRGTTAHLRGTYPTLTVQDTSSSVDALNLYTAVIATLRIVGGRGTINIDTNSTITSAIEQIGADGVTTILADGATVTGSTLTMDSGSFTMNEAIPNITVFGGELESTITATETITLLEIYDGRVRFNPSAACIIDELIMYGGKFNSTESTASTFTIEDCLLHEGAVLDERSGIRNIVFTNPVQMEGGEVKYDVGREITIT